MTNLFQIFQGRHNTAICFFSLAGSMFHYMHRLDGTYISFVTLMMSFVLGHSIKDDYFSGEDAKLKDSSKSIGA